MKKLKSPTYSVYNDQGIFVVATRGPVSAAKIAKTYAKKAGESYIVIGEHVGRGKRARISRLKCVLRFGKNESVRCPYRSSKDKNWPKKCQKIARVRCHPTRSIPRPVKFGKRKKR